MPATRIWAVTLIILFAGGMAIWWLMADTSEPQSVASGAAEQAEDALIPARLDTTADEGAAQAVTKEQPTLADDVAVSIESLDQLLQSLPDTGLDDVRADLERRFEDGDAEAAWQLYQIARYCNGSMQWIALWRSARENELDPERRMALSEEIERFEAIQAACHNSEMADRKVNQREMGFWQWQAADAGVEQAMLSLAFSSQSTTSGYASFASDSDIAGLAERQRQYADELRANCNVDAFHRMGEGFAEDDPFLRGMESRAHPDRDRETAIQIEAFAHQYAAATLDADVDPGRYARNPDHVLTASEEAGAIQLAESLLSNCQ